MSTDVLSTVDWWREAGVDFLVDESPRDWLAAPKPRPMAPSPQPRRQPADEPTVAAQADTLESIVALYAGDPVFGRADGRLLPAGNPASGLMVLTDQPEPDDAEGGQIIGGDAGRLLDRMLGAIGRDRASIYLAAMTPVRAPGGRADAKLVARWTDIARRHVAVAQPRVLLLFGDAASRAFIGTSMAEARGRLHSLNHGGGTVAMIATFHPRFLLQQPARKADAWRDLRLLLGELNQ